MANSLLRCWNASFFLIGHKIPSPLKQHYPKHTVCFSPQHVLSKLETEISEYRTRARSYECQVAKLPRYECRSVTDFVIFILIKTRIHCFDLDTRGSDCAFITDGRILLNMLAKLIFNPTHFTPGNVFI